jgi:hypothetical protein
MMVAFATAIAGALIVEAAMIVQIVKFKSTLPDAEVRRIMHARADRFRAQSGLVQKYYGFEANTGMHTGIYIWQSLDAMQAYRDSDLARSIPSAYQVEAPPRVEVFEMIFPLRDMPEIAARAAE